MTTESYAITRYFSPCENIRFCQTLIIQDIHRQRDLSIDWVLHRQAIDAFITCSSEEIYARMITLNLNIWGISVRSVLSNDDRLTRYRKNTGAEFLNLQLSEYHIAKQKSADVHRPVSKIWPHGRTSTYIFNQDIAVWIVNRASYASHRDITFRFVLESQHHGVLLAIDDIFIYDTLDMNRVEETWTTYGRRRCFRGRMQRPISLVLCHCQLALYEANEVMIRLPGYKLLN